MSDCLYNAIIKLSRYQTNNQIQVHNDRKTKATEIHVI